MEGHFSEAVALAAEISKQLIALATGILTITITFASQFAKRLSIGQRRLLTASWVGYTATIVFSLWHLSALTGNLLREKIDPMLTSAELPAWLQIVSFIFATVAFVVFAVLVARSLAEAEDETQQT